MTAEPGTHTGHEDFGSSPPPPPPPLPDHPSPELVLCAVDDLLAQAWTTVADTVDGRIQVHRGSVLDVVAQAVVSPANSYGWMRAGIDSVYARAYPGVEQNVRSAVLAYHGGELPIGEAVIVPTGEAEPAWLISAPTMRKPGEQLPRETVHPYLAARAVFQQWRDGHLDQGTRVRDLVHTIAMPGLGTGVGGVAPATCARQVAAAWEEVFTPRRTRNGR